MKRYGQTWLRFRMEGLAKPGTVVRLSDGSRMLVGNVNEHGNQQEGCHGCEASCNYARRCFGCQPSVALKPERIISAYDTLAPRPKRVRWVLAGAVIGAGLGLLLEMVL